MPNVVFIMTDNQGAWTLGCYGNPNIQTPNIDRLADEGIRFSNAYCVNSVCSPSRATFMTGLIPSQHGVHCYLGGEKTRCTDGTRRVLYHWGICKPPPRNGRCGIYMWIERKMAPGRQPAAPGRIFILVYPPEGTYHDILRRRIDLAGSGLQRTPIHNRSHNRTRPGILAAKPPSAIFSLRSVQRSLRPGKKHVGNTCQPAHRILCGQRIAEFPQGVGTSVATQQSGHD